MLLTQPRATFAAFSFGCDTLGVECARAGSGECVKGRCRPLPLPVPLPRTRGGCGVQQPGGAEHVLERGLSTSGCSGPFGSCSGVTDGPLLLLNCAAVPRLLLFRTLPLLPQPFRHSPGFLRGIRLPFVPAAGLRSPPLRRATDTLRAAQALLRGPHDTPRGPPEAPRAPRDACKPRQERAEREARGALRHDPHGVFRTTVSEVLLPLVFPARGALQGRDCCATPPTQEDVTVVSFLHPL
mmetsp:Transcript_88396/g.175761  ORF Transcript_88396/g.175761 Transcript_88396/m.175761 type:complete len:240 (+) Transcript_88396:385-1104(+)